jgi:O-methyltransferase
MPTLAKSALRYLLKNLLKKRGYSLIPSWKVPSEFPRDFDPALQTLCRDVGPFTMTTPERIFALRQSVQHIIRNKIPGDIVECGVWKGGSMMVVAKTLLELGVSNRDLHLFDTYEGMSEPTNIDRSRTGETASELLSTADKETSWVWANSPLEEVKRNVLGCGYPSQHLTFIQGKVEDTLPKSAPERISLLRLDTDWYESTYHELVHLYPRLSNGGILIIDDYGDWQGARKAVDQYFQEQGFTPLLQRIDYTGRICVKGS